MNPILKSIGQKSIGTGKKLLINTNTTIAKSIENNQYKYFLKVLKIQIVLMVKGLPLVRNSVLLKYLILMMVALSQEIR